MAETRGEQSTFGWASEPDRRAEEAAPPTARARPARKARAPAKASEPELPPDNELWDVHAAARFLKRSVSWVYHKAEDGTLPVRRLGGWGIRFVPAELRTWVVSGDDGRGR
jgi:predicted DNA-binding transcriptional regulator AlpA